MGHFLAIVAFLCGGSAAAADRLEVSVDWRGVSDRLIRRCDLSGLENLLLQSIVDEGYAVANQVGPRGIQVELLERGRLILVSARAAGNEEAAALTVPKPCDSTVQVDLVRVALDLVAEVAPHLEERPPTVVAPPAPPPALPELPPGLGLEVAAGAVVPGSTSLLPWMRASLWGRVAGRLLWGVALESALSADRDPFVAEPALAVHGRYRLLEADMRVDAGVEAALLGHVFFREDLDPDGHVDARVSIPVSVAWPDWHVGATLLPFLRLREVEHRRLDGTPVYHSGRFGLIVAVFWSVDLGT